jgi:hypothetical protein
MITLAYLIIAIVTLLILYFDIYAIVDCALGTKTTAVKSIWILVVLVMPVLGMVLYFLFGRR